MKLRNFLAMTAVAFVAVGMVSCDDDDEFIHPSAGEYFGENSMTVMGSTDVDPNAVVKIFSVNENAVTVVLPETSKSNKAMTLPTLKLNNLPVTGENGAYTISLPTDTLKLQAPREDGTKMNIAIWGLNGTVKGNDLKLSYQIKMGKMPMPLVNVFKGAKKN